MARLILPKTKISNLELPLIFLAGPIKGALNWQDKAIERIKKSPEEIYIASPNIHLREEYLQNQERSNELDFPYQLNWERHYLNLAYKNGVIMFWLPTQKEAMPINEKTGFPQTYARDTRPETAGWGWKLLEKNPYARIIVGGEEDFDGFNVIQRNFIAIRPNMKFYSTLEETCDEAIKLANLKAA